MPKIKNTIRNLISSDKLLDQSSDQIYRETVGKMDYRPFWPILYHLFAKYE